jgi:hypothetical protein
MSIIELAELGEAMRLAQKRYFRARRYTDLEASKALESRFDAAVRSILVQPALFAMPGDPPAHSRGQIHESS